MVTGGTGGSTHDFARDMTCGEGRKVSWYTLKHAKGLNLLLIMRSTLHNRQKNKKQNNQQFSAKGSFTG